MCARIRLAVCKYVALFAFSIVIIMKENKMVLKRIGVASTGKMLGCLYAIMGLFIGLVFSVASLVGGMAGGMKGAAGIEAIFGVGAVIVLPLFYGVMGYIAGILLAVTYNIVAGIIGGVEMEFIHPAQDEAL